MDKDILMRFEETLLFLAKSLIDKSKHNTLPFGFSGGDHSTASSVELMVSTVGGCSPSGGACAVTTVTGWLFKQPPLVQACTEKTYLVNGMRFQIIAEVFKPSY